MRSLLILLTLGCSGCGAIEPIASVIGAAASATSGYYSYKVYQQDPVEVTTLSKECVLGLKYARISCETREVMTDEEKRLLAENNRKLVEICGIEKPEAITCP